MDRIRGRNVSMKYGLGMSQVFRDIKYKHSSSPRRLTSSDEIRLDYVENIFALSVDGLAEQCLRQLFKTSATHEEKSLVNVPEEKLSTCGYTCYKHKVKLCHNRQAPYRTTEVTVRTYIVPLCLRTQFAVTKDQYDICCSPYLESDPIAIRKLRELAIKAHRVCFGLRGISTLWQLINLENLKRVRIMITRFGEIKFEHQPQGHLHSGTKAIEYGLPPINDTNIKPNDYENFYELCRFFREQELKHGFVNVPEGDNPDTYVPEILRGYYSVLIGPNGPIY